MYLSLKARGVPFSFLNDDLCGKKGVTTYLLNYLISMYGVCGFVLITILRDGRLEDTPYCVLDPPRAVRENVADGDGMNGPSGSSGKGNLKQAVP